MRQHLWQQGGDVCVHGSEPGVGRGGVFAAQHHRVLAVWRVKLQQSKSDKDSKDRTRPKVSLFPRLANKDEEQLTCSPSLAW